MPKPRVAPEVRRVIISARVTPAEKDTLLIVGEGNISRGLDRIMTEYAEKNPEPSPDGASQPLSCT